ncbi:MAG: hypothetical protein ACREHG_11415 [Candidatus Saccharimonadales bacterium]
MIQPDDFRIIKYFKCCKTVGAPIAIPQGANNPSNPLAIPLQDVLANMQPLDKPVPQIVEINQAWGEILSDLDV